MGFGGAGFFPAASSRYHIALLACSPTVLIFKLSPWETVRLQAAPWPWRSGLEVCRRSRFFRLWVESRRRKRFPPGHKSDMISRDKETVPSALAR